MNLGRIVTDRHTFESVEDLNFMLAILKRNNYNIGHLSTSTWYHIFSEHHDGSGQFWRQRARKFELSKNCFLIKVVILIQLILTKKAVKGVLQFESPNLKYQILNGLQHMCNPLCSKVELSAINLPELLTPFYQYMS